MSSVQLGVILTYLTILLGNVVSLLYTPIMLGILGQQEYGLFSLVNAIIAYIYLMDMGFGNAVIRYNAKYQAEGREEEQSQLNGMFVVLYAIIAVVALLIGGVVYINLEQMFSRSFSIGEIQLVKKLFVVALINVTLSFPLTIFSSIIIANERFVFAKGLSLIRTILNPIAMLSMLFLGQRSYGMVVASTILNLVIGGINIIYCHYQLKVKFYFRRFEWQVLKEIMGYSFFIFLSAIAYQIYWNTDQFILGVFVGSASIATYAVATQFNNYFISFSNVISGMFLPKLTKMVSVEENKEQMMKALVKVGRIQLIICLYIFGGFLLIGKEFITLWAGQDYELAYYISLIVMLPQVFSIVQSLFATLLEAMNKHRVKAFIYLGVAIINLILTLLLVQKWGIVGCAIGTAVGMLINALCNNIYYQYSLKLDMKYYWKQIIKLLPSIGGAYIVILPISWMMERSTYLHVIMMGSVYTGVFMISIYFFGLCKWEKEELSHLIKKLIRKH